MINREKHATWKFKTTILSFTLYDYSNTSVFVKRNLTTSYWARVYVVAFAGWKSSNMIELKNLFLYRYGIWIKKTHVNNTKFLDALTSSVPATVTWNNTFELVLLWIRWY